MIGKPARFVAVVFVLALVGVMAMMPSASAAPGVGYQQAALDAGDFFTCGVATDQTIDCWGQDTWGQIASPAGTFSQVSGGYFGACGLRTDGTSDCWGSWSSGDPATDGIGTYSQLTFGSGAACGITIGFRTVWCWGPGAGGLVVPASEFTFIDSGSGGAYCGIRLDQTLECWGLYSDAVTPTPPPGTYVDVSMTSYAGCAITTEGKLQCFGNNYAGQLDEPKGTYIQVDSAGTAGMGGEAHSCALRTDRRIVCWGQNNFGQLDAPGGPFMAVTTGAVHSCGLRPSGAVKCWGNNGWSESTPPAGMGFASCTVVGTSAGETLVGTPGPDVICGGGGPDVIRGKGGADWLLGEGGADRLVGSSGNDVLSGGPRSDALSGGKGIDLCLQDQGKGTSRACE